MLAFLVVFGVLGILVVCGVAISLYLYNRGALGRRSRRTRSVDTVAVETMSNEESDEQEIIFEPDIDGTSRYTRNSIFVFLGGLVVIGILLTTIISAIRH